MSKKLTQVEQMMQDHPWLMRWEMLKCTIEEFIWRFRHDRNRWCDKCGQCTGNSRKAHLAHRCAAPTARHENAIGAHRNEDMLRELAEKIRRS